MTQRRDVGPGLRLGGFIIGLVTLGFVGLFAFGPSAVKTPDPPVAETSGGLDLLEDAATQRALNALNRASPQTYQTLTIAVRRAVADGADTDDIAVLTLEALFSQFREQAIYVRSADSAQYQTIMTGLARGLKDLRAGQSDWCHGPAIADFLAQNDEDLVPGLLAEFPYQSPQYIWAMDWMSSVLAAAMQGQTQPQRHARPVPRDEEILQQAGRALGAEQWALALQIAAFANAEGTSYAQMQEVIAGMNVCDLGIAIETVSARLPSDVRARIWADLMPEIMVGNTPYVMWRVTDYFFIG